MLEKGEMKNEEMKKRREHQYMPRIFQMEIWKVCVVVRLQPSLSLHSFASSALGSGSCSHKIRQNRYSLSKIFGVDIGIPSLSNTLDCNCSLTH